MSTTIEAPLNFERRSPGGDSTAEDAAHTLAEKVTRLFRADGAVALTVQKLEEIMASERSSDQKRDELEDLIYRAAKAGAEYGGSRYEEAPREPRDKGPSWKERILTICGTLVVIGIPALILMYGRLSAMEASLASLQRQVDQMQIIMSRKP